MYAVFGAAILSHCIGLQELHNDQVSENSVHSILNIVGLIVPSGNHGKVVVCEVYEMRGVSVLCSSFNAEIYLYTYRAIVAVSCEKWTASIVGQTH